jgi:Glycosyltransferase family 87
MTIKKMGLGFISIGMLGILCSLVVDLLPGGKAGIQSAQILGIEVSIALTLLGLWATLRTADEKINVGKQIRHTIDWVLNLPVSAWVLVGFLIAYILFFVSPMFLNSALRMNYFNRYLPDRSPIGNDLIVILDLMKGWFLADQSPYTVQFYPPFTYVFFAPLLLVDNYSTLYRFFTLFSLLSYCFLSLVLPAKIVDRKNIPLVLLFFITGLTSYGFQFELERGQYNVFTFLLCLWSIYIFHYHPKYRIFAYLLFSLAIQLKLYPAIFIVMLIDNWRSWKSILLRFAGIAIFNILLFFIMGYRIFLDFLRAVSSQIGTPGWTWNGNHSMNAFVFNLTKDGFRIVPPDTLEMLRQNSGLIETSLLLIFGILFITAILISYKRNRPGLDPYLLIACMIGALIIPISNDYTLSILAVPVTLVLCSIPEPKNIPQRLISIIMVLGISFSYASMLIPFKYKPYYLNNAFPPLFFILIFATVLNLIRYKDAETPSSLAIPSPFDRS